MAYSVYNQDFQRLSFLESFKSATWEENYVGLGNFMLVLTETEENVKVFQVGNFVKRLDFDSVMIINSVIHDEHHQITILGGSALHLLTRRILAETITIGNAEQSMRNAFSKMLGFNNFVLGEFKGFSEKFEPKFETSYTNIFDLFQKICLETGLGIRTILNPKTKKLIFDIYKGEEKINAIYSDIWGNLLGSQLTKSDIKYKNVAIVAGQGKQQERIVVEVGELEKFNYDRFEMFVDARDLRQEENESLEAYKNKLFARGREKLALNHKILEVVVNIPSVDYGSRFFLGDFIKINIERYNLKLDIRIQGFTIKQQNNLETLELNLGIPIIRN